MVNSEEFSKRLQKILEYYELSAAAFADAIDVGRSSISHILSGRNKPSLDFVLKIVQTYPEVELYWLLNGKGSFPKQTDKAIHPAADISSPELFAGPKPEQKEAKSNLAFPDPPSSGFSQKGKTIKKIVIFYNDGSFEAFEN